jgi:hypothetical protein
MTSQDIDSFMVRPPESGEFEAIRIADPATVLASGLNAVRQINPDLLLG